MKRTLIAIMTVVSVLTLPACSFSINSPAGPAQVSSQAPAGMNSSFSKEGVREIKRTRVAKIDLSAGTLTAKQLGAPESKDLWDLSTPINHPVTLTIFGPNGQLQANTNTIRILADDSGAVRTISYFTAFSDVTKLIDQVREDAKLVGINSFDVESFLREAAQGREMQLVLNGGKDLGFEVSIAITIDPNKPGQVLQYIITPPPR